MNDTQPSRLEVFISSTSHDLAPYRRRFGWTETALDRSEARHPPQRPLLEFLERLNRELPKRWDARKQALVPDDDWLLWDLRAHGKGADVSGPTEPGSRRR